MTMAARGSRRGRIVAAAPRGVVDAGAGIVAAAGVAGRGRGRGGRSRGGRWIAAAAVAVAHAGRGQILAGRGGAGGGWPPPPSLSHTPGGVRSSTGVPGRPGTWSIGTHAAWTVTVMTEPS